MVAFDDEAKQEAGWKTFLASDGWKTLKSKPIYKDTVSGITNLVLRPADGSQI